MAHRVGLAVLLLAAGCSPEANWRPPELNPAAARPAGALAARPAGQAAPDLPGNPRLADYLACAALNNPALHAAFLRWQAALEMVPQARALPDPQFSYEADVRDGPKNHTLKIQQMFPAPGKLDLRGQAAVAAAEAARQQYEAAKLALFFTVKDAYYEYYYLGQSVEVTRQNVRLLEYLEGVVRARYRAGAAGHPDLIRLQVELGKLQDALRTLEDSRGSVAAKLNAAMNLPTGRSLPWPEEIEPSETAVPEGDLVAWAMDDNPRLKASEAEVARAWRQVELARKDYWPDVMLGLGWTDMSDSGGGMGGGGPDNPLMAMVSINLPIWFDKLQAGVREARLRHLAAVKERDDQTNALAADVRLAAYLYRDAERKEELYRTLLIPRATESLKVAEAAFRAGGAGFSDLIDAQRVLLEFQLTRQRALTDRARGLARLEMLIGREIPRVEGATTVPATAPAAPATAPAE